MHIWYFKYLFFCLLTMLKPKFLHLASTVDFFLFSITQVLILRIMIYLHYISSFLFFYNHSYCEISISTDGLSVYDIIPSTWFLLVFLEF
jgi:hypothetical protein